MRSILLKNSWAWCFLVLMTFFGGLEGKASKSKNDDLEPPSPKLPKAEALNGRPFIKGELRNQLGNQMFEVAAAVSVALDNNAVAVFPDLVEMKQWKVPENFRNVFWRLNPTKPEKASEFYHSYHGLPYEPIPYHPNMTLNGLFHSEKYFAHHKKEILDLFAPHPSFIKYLYKKHPWLLKNYNTVAVHVRAYWPHYPGGWEDGKGVLPFLGLEYFKKAILSFPKESFFVVFSNNMEWCKSNFQQIDRNFIYIEGQSHHLDLFMMSLCKHNIISNSSYSWWGAWLNQNPNKIVIAPKLWFEPSSGIDDRDVIPDGWKVLE